MEQELKQRLIGVIVVVTLAVIFVPMLFDKREDRERAVNGVPPIPENVRETQLELPKTAEDLAPKEDKSTDQSGFKVIPLTEAPAAKSDTTEAAPAKPQEPTAAEALSAPATDEEEFAGTQAKPNKAEAKVERSGATNADAEKLSKPAVVEHPADVIKKPKIADTVAKKPPVSAPAQAQSELVMGGKKPKPVPAPINEANEPLAASPVKPAVAKPAPTPKLTNAEMPKPAPVPAAMAQTPKTPSAPTTPEVWVIQTGSFTTESKARALAEKLRQAKFPAFVESASSDHGTTYRVHVGPELDRAHAELIQRQVETSSGIKGIIVPHH